MTPSRPYLLRALYNWIVDNKMIPHIVVNTTLPGVDVPKEHIKDGKIVLDIRPGAIKDLEITNEYVKFQARFLVVRTVYAPMQAVTAIYAMENGKGMVFPEEDFSMAADVAKPQADDQKTTDSKTPPKKPPNLKLVE